MCNNVHNYTSNITMYLQISLIKKDNTGEILNKIVIELLPAKNANSSVFIVSVKFPND
jgi:hypothetical protein